MVQKGPVLARSDADHPIQAFPLVEGFINLSVDDSPVTKVTLVQCLTDGDITITFNSGNTKTVSLFYGDIYSLPDAHSVAIVSGTFNFG